MVECQRVSPDLRSSLLADLGLLWQEVISYRYPFLAVKASPESRYASTIWSL